MATTNVAKLIMDDKKTLNTKIANTMRLGNTKKEPQLDKKK